jgi:glycosyltransferase involved in cell wall biosynthesis
MTAAAHIDLASTAPGPSPDGPDSIRTLQLGMSWFSEQPGGLQRYYQELLKHLPAARVSVRGLVCGTDAVERQTSGTVRAPVRSEASLARRLTAFRRAVRREMLEFRPDVVVSHFALYVWPALRYLKGLPLVVHFHGPWYAESRMEGSIPLKTWAKYLIERAVYRRADCIITLSNAFKDVLINDFDVMGSRIRVVPGGVDARRFDVPQTRSEARAHFGWPQDRRIVLSVRRLTRRMGLEQLIDAAGIVSAKIPDALFLLAGEGRRRSELRAAIDSTGLAEHVRLLGYLSDGELPLAYRAADLSVVPSIALEGFGLSAAESLAAGTPVVVTPVGGLPEIIRPLRSNLVSSDASSGELARTVTAAFASPDGLPSSEECRRYARRFDWSSIVFAIRDALCTLPMKGWTG